MASVIQSGYVVDDTGSGTTTILVTLSNVTSGNTILVHVGWGDGGTTTCTVNDGTAYSTAAAKIRNSTETQSGQVFILENVSSGTHTITATFSETTSFRRIRAIEIFGTAKSNSIDQATGQSQQTPGTGTDGISSGATSTTTNATDFVVGFTQNVATIEPGLGTLSAGTGYTLNGSNILLGVDYKTVSTTGAQTATFTQSDGKARITHVVVLKELSNTPVQSTTASCAAASSIAATLTGTVSGNLIVGIVSWIDIYDITSRVPTVPSGFLAASNPTSSVNTVAAGTNIYYKVSTGGSVTCTFDEPSGANSLLYAKISLIEWGGMVSTPFDVAATTVTNNSAASTTGVTVGASSTLAQANEIVVAAVTISCNPGLANAGISNPPSGYTSIQVYQSSNTATSMQHSWKDTNSTAGQSCTWAWTADSSMLSYQAVLVTFKETTVLPPISVFQTVETSSDVTGSTTLAAPSMTVAADSYLHLICGHYNSSIDLAATPITSSPSLTWTRLGTRIVDTVNNQILYHFVSSVTSAGAIVCTVNYNASAQYRAVCVKEIRGSSGYDSAAAAYNYTYDANPGTGTDAVSSGATPTLTRQPALVSGFSQDVFGTNGSPLPGTGFSADSIGWGYGSPTLTSRGENKRVVDTTGVAATFTQLGAGANIEHLSVVAVFLEVSTITRPSADVTTSGWVASTGTDFFALIDETSYNDADYFTSPTLGTGSPITLTLSSSIVAGTYDVRIRAKRTDTVGQVRVLLLDGSNTTMGTSSWQALTTSFASYTLSVTTSGTATRVRIEVST